MELLYLLAQQTPDFSQVPPPEGEAAQSIASYWPLITAVISLVIAGISALFTAWQKIRERKLENAASSEQTRLNLEIEELKHQFESRAQLHEQLTTQITNLLTEGRELRKELQDARAAAIEKDKMIADLRAEVATLRSDLNFANAELERLKRKIENPPDDSGGNAGS